MAVEKPLSSEPSRPAEAELEPTPSGVGDQCVAAKADAFRLVDSSGSKQTDDSVRRSEERLRQVLESAASAMVMVDRTGRIVLVNGQLETFFGYPRGELIGQQVEILVPERFRATHPEHRSSFFANPATRAMGAGRDLFGLRKDGRELPVEIGLSPVETDDGLMILGTIVDITQRVEHERDRARLAAIVDSSHDAIIGKTIDGTITSWNAGAEQMYGYTAQEAVGRPISMLLPDGHADEIAALLERLAQDERIEGFETVRQTKDGRKIDVSLTISPLRGSAGHIVGASTIARDITRRKRDETKLRLLQSVTEAISTSGDFDSAMENALRLLCETIGWDYGEAWVLSSDESTLLRCPGAYLANLGIEPFARGRSGLTLPADKRQAWPSREPKWIANVNAEPDGVFALGETAVEAGIKGGFAAPIVMDDKVLALLAFFMTSPPGKEDVAEVIDLVQSVASQLGSVVQRKRIDAELRHAYAELEQRNREMEEFVYTVSHDLKSPLVTLGGMLGMLKEELQHERLEDAGEYIATAEDTVAGMCQTIADLLKLSQVGRAACNLEPVSLKELIGEVVGRFAAQLESRGVVVEVADNSLSVVADRRRLHEVLDNLLVNALKYACHRPDPRITIGSEAADNEVRLFVRDNGPGIAPEYHEKVFGLFQRLQTDKQGSGVGLTIVKRIMEVHGGRAWVESQVGDGATFWLALPSPESQPAVSRL